MASSTSIWHEIESAPIGAQISGNNIVDALSVYIEKPHVVNKRLAGVTLSGNWTSNVLRSIDTDGCNRAADRILNEAVLDLVKQYFVSTQHSFQDLETVLCATGHRINAWTGIVVIRKLVLKHSKNSCPDDIFELILFEASPIRCTVLPFRSNCVKQPLDLHFVDIGHQFLLLESHSDSGTLEARLTVRQCHMPSAAPLELYTSAWLAGPLLQKIVSWGSAASISTSRNSLRLVAVDRYYQLYHKMKSKYGIAIAQVWPECTDPQKFVFEDVAIASYLMCLWENERTDQECTKLQSFVDLGCGNGLLVYILTQEGFPGRGIDTRRRKIWSMFGCSTQLEETTIIPSDQHLFPECDWIIGNHSDELTPWIPVIAARSSPNTRFFLLPCCPFDFSGKFVRREIKRSIYDEYLGYIEDVAMVCGFECKRDVLRIPSTKRECIIGYCVSRDPAEECEVSARINCVLSSGCPRSAVSRSRQSLAERAAAAAGRGPPDGSDCAPGLATLASGDAATCRLRSSSTEADLCSAGTDGCLHTGIVPADLASGSSLVRVGTRDCSETTAAAAVEPSSNAWKLEFLPRPREQEIRNCTNIDRTVQDAVVQAVFRCILNADGSELSTRYDGSPWKPGGRVAIAALAALFDRETLASMKSHFGGLQTLLRNHSHIFHVYDGKVGLRNYSIPRAALPRGNASKKRKRAEPKKFKTKPCFYDCHHPDGCPVSSDVCSYVHVSASPAPGV